MGHPLPAPQPCGHVPSAAVAVPSCSVCVSSGGPGGGRKDGDTPRDVTAGNAASPNMEEPLRQVRDGTPGAAPAWAQPPGVTLVGRWDHHALGALGSVPQGWVPPQPCPRGVPGPPPPDSAVQSNAFKWCRGGWGQVNMGRGHQVVFKPTANCNPPLPASSVRIHRGWDPQILCFLLPHLWKYSRPRWTEFGATSDSGRCPCPCPW